ncbi:unnamed protein product [Dovyalis caffra]|uniref:Uncharacterized protein n=1 Tax=Dovyalis caffra TaxID=77055 RepID=A0AAV1SAF8_9ROSI|nr:unnamed protein product [Dovyalis caffra]
MGVLLGRLWEIEPLTDQLPGLKELVGGIGKLFAYSLIASHMDSPWFSVDISALAKSSHLEDAVYITLFGRANALG